MLLHLFGFYLWINYLSIRITVHGQSGNDNKTDDEFRRHIAEDGFKPAIFGSHAYDPIKNCFEKKKIESEKKKGGMSTVLGGETTPEPADTQKAEVPTVATAVPTVEVAGTQQPTAATPAPGALPTAPTTPADVLRYLARSTFWWARAKDSYQKNMTHYLKNAII